MMDACHVSSLALRSIPMMPMGDDPVGIVREGLVFRLRDIVVVLQQVVPAGIEALSHDVGVDAAPNKKECRHQSRFPRSRLVAEEKQ